MLQVVGLSEMDVSLGGLGGSAWDPTPHPPCHSHAGMEVLVPLWLLPAW